MFLQLCLFSSTISFTGSHRAITILSSPRGAQAQLGFAAAACQPAAMHTHMYAVGSRGRALACFPGSCPALPA